MSRGAGAHGAGWAASLAIALFATLSASLGAGGCLEPDDTSGAPPGSTAPTSTEVTSDESADPILARLAEKPLRITRHGRCRMACRQISEDEVRDLLDTGTIAADRTRTDGECVSYAVEGRTDDGQDVRIVYADCERETRVVTTIDLGREWPCECR